MTELNDLTMLTAIRRCSETENYKVGIFVKTKKMADDAYEDAIGFIKEDEDEMNAIHRCTKILMPPFNLEMVATLDFCHQARMREDLRSMKFCAHQILIATLCVVS